MMNASFHKQTSPKREQRSLLSWAISAALLVNPVTTSAGEYVLKDFSDVSSLVLNGDTKTVSTPDGVALRLTEATRLQSGSVFSAVKISTATFSTYFQFRVTEPGGVLSGGDGFVFVVQPVSSNAGSEGGGIGYAGIPKSIGVEFDTWNNQAETDSRNDTNDNHVGINIKGSFNGPTAHVAPLFENGKIWHAWIDYNGTQLEVRTNTSGERPTEPLLTRKLDIADIIGSVPEAYIGFTSATGGAFANYDILSWTFRDKFAPVGADHVDVWMADSKGDTGAEPNKVSRRFWLSPDLWIRNQPDGVAKYQNVEFGQDNYVYVRAKNRGTIPAQNTTVEVYRSVPSIGNRWPNGWQFVGKANIDNIEPDASQEIAIRWNKNDIPKPGHYCFYVRLLNNDDPMKFTERGDSLVNIRQNNAIVSRNFNVVDLSKNVSDEFEVTVQNTKDEDAEVDLVFEEENQLLDNEGASATVDLGPLFHRWQEAGGKGENVKPLEGTKIQLLKTPAKLTGIPMKPAEAQKVRMRVGAFKPLEGEGDSREYHFSTQAVIDGEPIGGVDYAITARAQDADSDKDGIKDVDDTDDDNDCISDEREIQAGLNPLNPWDASLKSTVDFESIAGITPTPGMEISHQFEKSHGITFSSSTARVTLVKAGEEPVAYVSVYGADGNKTSRQNKPNRPAPDAKVGQFMLMAKHSTGADLTLTYTHPVAQASGEVLDIDGGEVLVAVAKDSEGKELARQIVDKNLPNAGDGRAVRWAFQMTTPVIKTIEITQRGKGLGIAFDNFSAKLCAKQPKSGLSFQPKVPELFTSEARTPTTGNVPTICNCPTPPPSTQDCTIRLESAPDTTITPKENVIRLEMAPGICPTDAGDNTIRVEMVPTPTPTRDNNRRYTDNGDSTVTDNHSGLIWLKNANCIGSQYPDFGKQCDCTEQNGKVTWQQAQTFVEGLNQGQFPECDSNHTDWRLPNVQEMQSVVHYGFHNPAMSNAIGNGPWQEDDAFTNIQSESYWTSTPDASNPSMAWRLRLDRGILFTEHKSYPFHVWPVREEQYNCQCPENK